MCENLITVYNHGIIASTYIFIHDAIFEAVTCGDTLIREEASRNWTTETQKLISRVLRASSKYTIFVVINTQRSP